MDAMIEEPMGQPGAARQLNRRGFMTLASLGLVFLDVGAATYFYALPRFKEGQFGGLFPLGLAGALPPEGITPVNMPAGSFCLVRTPQVLLALYKVCTHLGCLYGWEPALDRFRCPCHGSDFLYDGTRFKTPAPRSQDRFVIQAFDPQTGAVLAETGPEGGPLPVPGDPRTPLDVDRGGASRGLAPRVKAGPNRQLDPGIGPLPVRSEGLFI